MAIRVGVFLPDLRGGGAERSLLNIANGLAMRGHQVDLVLAGSGGALRSQVADGVNLTELGAQSTLAGVPRWARLVRRRRYDALLSGMDHANVATLLARRLAGGSARSVVTIHNHISVENRGSRRGQAILAAARRLYRKADGIVAVSQGVREDACRTFDLAEGRVHVIHNPVLTKGFESALKQTEPLAGETPYILAVGRLEPQKDYTTLLKALKSVPAPYRLRILGEGNERAKLESSARELGIADRVDLPGFVSDPVPAMKGASAFALSSRFEGLPTVLIEALAAGTPIVSTDCPSGPDEILEGGKWGRLVPVGDSAALASGLIEALQSEAKSVPPTTVLDRYREENVLKLYEAELGALHG